MDWRGHVLPHLWRRRNQENQVLQRKSSTGFEEKIKSKMNNIKQQQNLQKTCQRHCDNPKPTSGWCQKEDGALALKEEKTKPCNTDACPGV